MQIISPRSTSYLLHTVGISGRWFKTIVGRRVFSSSRLPDGIDILPQGASILLSPGQRLSQATTRAQTLCFLRCISESVWYEKVTWRQTSCAERCRSGRTGRIRNPLYLQGYPGFESLSLCHLYCLYDYFYCLKNEIIFSVPRFIPTVCAGLNAAKRGALKWKNTGGLCVLTELSCVACTRYVDLECSLAPQGLCPLGRRSLCGGTL